MMSCWLLEAVAVIHARFCTAFPLLLLALVDNLLRDTVMPETRAAALVLAGLVASSQGAAQPSAAAILFCAFVFAEDGAGIPQLLSRLYQMAYVVDAATLEAFLDHGLQLLKGAAAQGRHKAGTSSSRISWTSQLQRLCEVVEATRAAQALDTAEAGLGPCRPEETAVRGVLSWCGKTLTVEQARIVVAANTLQDKVMWVQAFAGSAKTFTARAIVAHHRSLRILYVVFNKKNRVEARTAMWDDWQHRTTRTGGKANFTVKTTHSLAYGWAAENFPNRVMGSACSQHCIRLHTTPTPTTLLRSNKIPPAMIRYRLAVLWNLVGQGRSINSSLKAIGYPAVKAVSDGLDCFLASDSEDLGKEHFKRLYGKARELALEAVGNALAAAAELAAGGAAASSIREDRSPRSTRPPNEVCFNTLVNAARDLWVDMRRPDSILPLTHNAYLKLFALSKPTLVDMDYVPYDLIVVDETQDLNAVTRQLVVDCQTKTPVILLGDQYQQIYSFNYACGLMGPAGRRMIPKERHGPTLPLSSAFRYDREIAAAINPILKALGEEGCVVGRRHEATPANPASVVYVTAPLDKDPRCASIQELASAIGSGASRWVQLPLQSAVPNPAWPLELSRAGPGCDAVAIPDTMLPGTWPRVMLVARYNLTLVRLSLELAALGFKVCVTFGQKAKEEPAAQQPQAQPSLTPPAAGAPPAAATPTGAQTPLSRKSLPFHLQLVLDVADLRDGVVRNHPEDHPMHGLADVAELTEMVQSGLEPELALALKLVDQLAGPSEEGGPSAASRVEAKLVDLASRLVLERSQADYYLVTSHKAKGDEAPIVQLADDFTVKLAPTEEKGRNRLDRIVQNSGYGPAPDEANALYVAATRAQRVLVCNQDVSALLLRMDAPTLRPRPPLELVENTRAGVAGGPSAWPSAELTAGPNAGGAWAAGPGPSAAGAGGGRDASKRLHADLREGPGDHAEGPAAKAIRSSSVPSGVGPPSGTAAGGGAGAGGDASSAGSGRGAEDDDEAFVAACCAALDAFERQEEERQRQGAQGQQQGAHGSDPGAGGAGDGGGEAAQEATSLACPECGEYSRPDPQVTSRWRVESRGRLLCRACEMDSIFGPTLALVQGQAAQAAPGCRQWQLQPPQACYPPQGPAGYQQAPQACYPSQGPAGYQPPLQAGYLPRGPTGYQQAPQACYPAQGPAGYQQAPRDCYPAQGPAGYQQHPQAVWHSSSAATVPFRGRGPSRDGHSKAGWEAGPGPDTRPTLGHGA
ncbi:hypothetical protein HYH03_007443 [Edaphochlamys debaryana]|uniref:DNA helicase n=1 Tax=Edaphochlamys debaryana TaxID=47281 RepID=A0A835Y8J4_9CHLO|nr:hypothetical protein HYH03_007443 [Edaphochlamys debaryana]|eukprot:KAG2494390.1 hypothetical protein HYH03_007443 [Edaphochlamys debaryana]